MKRKLSYSSEDDVLYFNEGEAVQDGLDIGDFYIEFSSEGSVTGIEILEASDTISQLTGQDFSREDLENIKSAEIKIYRKGEFAFITLQFVIRREDQEVRESVGVNVPSSAVAA